MNAHNIEDLRDHLFDTLAALRDKEKPMDIDRAKAIAEVSKVIVDSAKVEVDYARISGHARTSGFLPQAAPPAKAGATAAADANPRAALKSW